MFKKQITVESTRKEQMIDITSEVKEVLQESKIEDGLVTVFVPHTTAAVTINENTDIDVKHDILLGLKYISPNRSEYLHYEKNSDAHLKSSLIGVSEQIIVENNDLVLGVWQGIYFCEFDGPRTRKVIISVLEG